MKIRKIIFGASWSLVGLVALYFITDYDASSQFPLTEWIWQGTDTGFYWFLVSGIFSLLVGLRFSIYASSSSLGVVLVAYIVLMLYEMIIMKCNHNIFPIEIAYFIVMRSPWLLSGAVCDIIIKLVKRENPKC